MKAVSPRDAAAALRAGNVAIVPTETVVGLVAAESGLPRVREITTKSLLGAGRVVINVSRLRSSESSFLTVFSATLDATGGWPSTRAPGV